MDVSVRDIMAACGLTSGALYAHFQSKEELLAGLVYGLHVRLANQLSALYELDGGHAERLARLIYCKISFALNNRSAARVANAGLKHLVGVKHERIHALRRTLDSYFDNTLAAGAAEGTFDLIVPVATRMAIFRLIGDALKWFDPNGEATAEEIARSHAETGLKMVLATGAAGIGVRAIVTAALQTGDGPRELHRGRRARGQMARRKKGD